jgi:hypothetical protein
MKEEALVWMDNTTQDKGRYYYLTSYLPLIHLRIYDSLRDESRFQLIVEREKEKYEKRLQKYRIPLKEKMASIK